MFARFKRFLSVLLSATILLAGSGFSGAFVAAVEHGLGIELALAADAMVVVGRTEVAAVLGATLELRVLVIAMV